MANGDDPSGVGPPDGGDDAASPPAGVGGSPPGGGGPPGPPGAGGPGGGPSPVLAALARRQMSPPISVPGQGDMAHGLMQLKSAVDIIQAALPSLASGSQQHRDALRAVQSLSRHLPQGAPTAGVQQTQLGDLLRGTVRNALLQRLMSQRGGGAGPSAGGMAPPPQPSTPLPGA